MTDDPRVDLTNAVDPPHHCRLPKIIVLVEDDDLDPLNELPKIPNLRMAYPEGARLHCACGTVWVVVWRPEQVGTHAVWCGGWEWREETRRQRRDRLRLRWWQRG